MEDESIVTVAENEGTPSISEPAAGRSGSMGDQISEAVKIALDSALKQHIPDLIKKTPKQSKASKKRERSSSPVFSSLESSSCSYASISSEYSPPPQGRKVIRKKKHGAKGVTDLHTFKKNKKSKRSKAKHSRVFLHPSSDSYSSDTGREERKPFFWNIKSTSFFVMAISTFSTDLFLLV